MVHVATGQCHQHSSIQQCVKASLLRVRIHWATDCSISNLASHLTPLRNLGSWLWVDGLFANMQAQQALDLRHHWNSVDLAQRCAPYDQQPGLHDQDESSVLDDNAEKNSCIVADSCRKHQTTHRGALLSLDGTPVLFDRRALTSSDTKARRTTRDRMIRRMAYVASTPVCLYTMGCYLASHELAAEGGESPSEWERHMPQVWLS